MKVYTEICIYCGEKRPATQIDQLPIPNTTSMFTKGMIWVPEFMRCLGGHTFVNLENYRLSQIEVDGTTVIPKQKWL